MKRWVCFFLCVAVSFVLACGDDDVAGRPDGGKVTLDRDGGDVRDEDGGVELAVVERGRYLVENVAACVDCHSPRNPDGSFAREKWLSGTDCIVDADPDDPEVGCVNSGNLTNHRTGLKNRSDEEIKDLFLKGVRPDGKALHPFMPYWALGNMKDADADAIVAYLRTVKGVDHMVAKNQEPFAPPDEPAPRVPDALIPLPQPDYENQAAALRGRYLAGSIGICLDCHTPRDESQRPILSKVFQGGNQFARDELRLPAVFPEVIYSANITPDKTGIADWSVGDIVNALKKGEDKDQDGSPLCPPMPAGPMGSFGGLTDRDAQDIAHYLRSLPPATNKIKEDCRPPAPSDVTTGN